MAGFLLKLVPSATVMAEVVNARLGWPMAGTLGVVAPGTMTVLVPGVMAAWKLPSRLASNMKAESPSSVLGSVTPSLAVWPAWPANK